MDFQIRGSGPGAIIVAYCEACRCTFEIERPTIVTHIKHGGPCQGKRERLPERIYESWCNAREAGKPRISIPTVRYI